MIRFTTYIVFFAIFSLLISADDPCRFDSPGNGVIDISSLSHSDGKAAYPDRNPQTGGDWSMRLLCLFVIII
jgi:hypothetical protein